MGIGQHHLSCWFHRILQERKSNPPPQGAKTKWFSPGGWVHQKQSNFCTQRSSQGGGQTCQPACWSRSTCWGGLAPSHTFCPRRFVFVRPGWRFGWKQLAAVAASAEQNLIGGAVGLAGGGQCQLEVGFQYLKKRCQEDECFLFRWTSPVWCSGTTISSPLNITWRGGWWNFTTSTQNDWGIMPWLVLFSK